MREHISQMATCSLLDGRILAINASNQRLFSQTAQAHQSHLQPERRRPARTLAPRALHQTDPQADTVRRCRDEVSHLHLGARSQWISKSVWQAVWAHDRLISNGP